MKKELLLDETAQSKLQSDKQRFLCKAVENYIQCLEQGEEHDTWVFRLASLWLENADVKAVNDMMKVRKTEAGWFSFALEFEIKGCLRKWKYSACIFLFQKGVKKIPSHKFLPLMYQLAARMGTKMATGISEDTGFHDVLNDVRQHFLNTCCMRTSTADFLLHADSQ